MELSQILAEAVRLADDQRHLHTRLELLIRNLAAYVDQRNSPQETPCPPPSPPYTPKP